MSALPESTNDGVVIAGDLQSRDERPTPLFGKDALSALNLFFFGTTVAGVAFEYFSNVPGAVAVMFVFLGYGFIYRKHVPNMERFADSTYYQGFILTLFALLFALTGKGANNITSDRIIQNFGLAIWTTCIGMTGRIFIIQFLATVRDEDDKARQSIAQYVEQLNAEITTALGQLQKFRSAIVDSAQKVSDELADESRRNRRETTDAIKTSMSALVRSVDQATKKLDQSVETVTDRISHVEIPADAFSVPLQRAAIAVEEDLKKLRTGLEQGTNNFAEVLRGNVAILQSTRADLTTFRTTLSEVNAMMATASSTTSESLGKTRETLKMSADAVAGIQTLAQAAATLAKQLGSLATSFEQRGKSYGSEFEEVANDMKAAANKTREEADKLAGAYVESAQKLSSAIREAGRANEPAE